MLESLLRRQVQAGTAARLSAAAGAAPPPGLPASATVVEVGPRDGLQSEPGVMIAADVKAGLVARLRAAGLPRIECAAFVSPKAVPQMADGYVRPRRRLGWWCSTTSTTTTMATTPTK